MQEMPMRSTGRSSIGVRWGMNAESQDEGFLRRRSRGFAASRRFDISAPAIA